LEQSGLCALSWSSDEPVDFLNFGRLQLRDSGAWRSAVRVKGFVHFARSGGACCVVQVSNGRTDAHYEFGCNCNGRSALVLIGPWRERGSATAPARGVSAAFAAPSSAGGGQLDEAAVRAELDAIVGVDEIVGGMDGTGAGVDETSVGVHGAGAELDRMVITGQAGARFEEGKATTTKGAATEQQAEEGPGTAELEAATAREKDQGGYGDKCTQQRQHDVRERAALRTASSPTNSSSSSPEHAAPQPAPVGAVFAALVQADTRFTTPRVVRRTSGGAPGASDVALLRARATCGSQGNSSGDGGSNSVNGDGGESTRDKDGGAGGACDDGGARGACKDSTVTTPTAALCEVEFSAIDLLGVPSAVLNLELLSRLSSAAGRWPAAPLWLAPLCVDVDPSALDSASASPSPNPTLRLRALIYTAGEGAPVHQSRADAQASADRAISPQLGASSDRQGWARLYEATAEVMVAHMAQIMCGGCCTLGDLRGLRPVT
jgi:hypothetical protein